MKDVRMTQIADGGLDILLENGKTIWAEEGIQVAQHASMRLKKFKGESALGNENEEGTDYYGIIFNAAKSRAEKEFHLKERILSTPGAKSITSFVWGIVTDDYGRSTVNIDCHITTDWGVVSLSEEVTPL